MDNKPKVEGAVRKDFILLKKGLILKFLSNKLL